MPTLDELGAALQNAHQAGDSEAATALANEIQKQSAKSKQPSMLSTIDRALGMVPTHVTPFQMAAKAMGNVPQAGDIAGGGVTDLATKAGASPEVAGAAGAGTNALIQAAPMVLGAGSSGAVPFAEGRAKWLMQSALKPAKADLQGGAESAAARAVQTMLDEGISPTSRGMDKAEKLAEKLHQQVAAPLAASREHVDIPSVIQRLEPLKSRVSLQVNPEADIAAVDKALSEFKGSPAISGASSIPVQLAQKLKSGTYSSLGNKAYGELGSTSTEAQKQLARGLREEVIAKVPEIAEPLKHEASLRNVMEVAAGRALQDANKNPLSLGTSIAAIMHDPLAAAGMWANASTPVKAMLARMLYQGTKAKAVIPPAIGAAELVNQPR